MDTLLTIICFVFLVMENLIGMVANGSIVLINFIDWFRRRKLSPTDLILTCIGLSRLLQLAIMILQVTASIWLNNMQRNTFFMLSGVWLFTDTVNFWFTACLGVFYLAKIAIFSCPAFLQVKQRFPGLVPWLLLGSVVFSVVVTVIVITSWSYGLSTCNPFILLSSNSSNAEMNIRQMCRNVIALFAPFYILPFMIFLSSSILLISSLWMHMRRVRRNGTGTEDLNTQAHLSAIKALASFAVLYLISFVATMSQLVLVWNNQYSWAALLIHLTAVYPSSHPIILILINPKLKEAWVKMLHHFKCHWSKVPS